MFSISCDAVILEELADEISEMIEDLWKVKDNG